MSIFSKLLKRGPEEGGPPSNERGDSPAPERPAPAARAAERPAPAARTEAERPAPATAPRVRTGRTGKQRTLGTETNGAPPRVPAAAARPAAAPVPSAAPAAAPAVALPGVTAAKPATSRVVPPVTAPSTSPFARVNPAQARPAVAPVVPPNGKAAAPAPVEAVVTMEAEPAGSLDGALELLVNGPPPVDGARGELTAADLQAVLATFEDLAVGHSAEVRNLMMEVRWGEAQTSWFELARPALKSLRAMAGQVEHGTLCTALDGFCVAVDEALAPGAAPSVGPVMRDKLLAAYAPLITALPRAFELQGERDRREPLVVRALLGQVPGLEPLMIDRMIGAGLGRLEPLLKARADEVAAVAGLGLDVAAAVVARVQAWKRETPAALATPDRAAACRELVALVRTLSDEHRAFEDAARAWNESARDAKKRLRRQREVSFLQITIVLARLGEVDLAVALEKLSFARRLEELGRMVSRFPAAILFAAQTETPARKIERDVPTGAHAAP